MFETLKTDKNVYSGHSPNIFSALFCNAIMLNLYATIFKDSLKPLSWKCTGCKTKHANSIYTCMCEN